MTLDYPLIWAALLAFAVLAYVVLDGFDLGVGLLSPLARDEHERDRMMNSIAPVWDGNETWLVLGGGGLLAAFPLAYAVAMPALYAPITAMLLGLIFRGVAFEFRARAHTRKYLWNWAFAGGSLLASFAQGVVLGAFVQGIVVAGRTYAGGAWDWLSPFSVATGIALITGYALLGATWLVMKTTDELQQRARRYARIAGAGTLTMIGIVSVWTPWLHPEYAERWFSRPAEFYTFAVPILVVLCAIALFRGLGRGPEHLPFLAALGLFVLSYAGLLLSFFPNIVPPSLTLWEAAAPDASLRFLLVGALVLLPLILTYTAYAYWVFRGKVDDAAHYH